MSDPKIRTPRSKAGETAGDYLSLLDQVPPHLQAKFLAVVERIPPAGRFMFAQALLDGEEELRQRIQWAEMLTIAAIAEYEDTTPDRIETLVAERKLFAVSHGGGGPRIPLWQLDPEVRPHLHSILTILERGGGSPWGIHEFFIGGDDCLGGLSPLEFLRAGGDPAKVVLLAKTIAEED